MSTPILPTQQQQPTVEALGLNVFAGCGQPEQPAACGGRPLGLYPENLPQPALPGMVPTVIQPQGLMAPPNHMSPAAQVPGIPKSFNAPGCQAASSPFEKMLDPRLQTSDRRDLTVISKVNAFKVGTSTFTIKDCPSIVCRMRPRSGSHRTRIIRISTSLMLPSQVTPSGLRQSLTTLVEPTVDGLDPSNGLSSKPNPYSMNNCRSSTLVA